MKNFGIRKKFIIILLVSTILPLSLAMLITYSYANNHFTEEALAYNNNLMYQYSANMENYLQTVSSCVYYPYSNSSVNSLLSTTSPNYSDYSTMLNFMQSVSSLSDDVNEIHLISFFRKTEYTYKNKTLTITKLTDAEIKTAIKTHLAQSTIPKLLPTHVSDEPTNMNNTLSHRVYTISYLMENVPKKEPMGFLTVDLSLKTLDILSSQMLTDENEILTIVDKSSNTVIYSTEYSWTEDTLDEHEQLSDIVSSISQSTGYITYQPGLNTSIVFYRTLDLLDTQWIIIKDIPSSSTQVSIYNFARLYLLIYLIFLIISVLLTMKITRHFTNPIIHLTNQMATIRYGEPFKPMVLDRNDEIGTLYSTFSNMVTKINDMILNEYELQLSQKNAQLRMLQAQLNPHFLNNALQSLGTLALQKQVPEIYTLITSLSHMMNYAMDFKDSLVSLGTEFDYTEYYLTFQRQRFGDVMHFSLELDPDTLDIVVPKMILQPLVENYFKHGFVKRAEGYYVSAKTRIENDTLFLTVENNGSCFDKAILEQLREGLRHNTEIMDNDAYAFGIGLYNIQTRLNLYYNHHGYILLENMMPYGVRIELQLSLKEGPNESSDR